MTREEFATRWANYEDTYGLTAWTEEGINDFCNINATSYEEYMAMYEILVDMAQNV